MFERAIVPLDGSATAEVALPYATEFTGRTGTELVLLFVKESHDYRSENILQCYLENMANKAREAAKPYFGESGITELKVSTKILTGDPSNEILNFAENTINSKIIMATHGQSGVGTRWTLGSVAEKVSRATKTPMVLIRAEGDKAAVHPRGILKKILAPVDGSKGSESALPYVEEMARRLKAEVVFLEILTTGVSSYRLLESPDLKIMRDDADAYLKKLVDDFKKKGINAQFVVQESFVDVGEEINQYTQKNYVDIVIMATHGHTGPVRWVLGSVTNQVLGEGNTPIMLVRTVESSRK